MTPAVPLPSLLLVESQFVLRRTIVAVAHDLGIARFHEVAGCDAAMPLLATRCFDGIVLDGSNAKAACELILRLRDGGFASDADIAVVVMTPAPGDPALVDRLRASRAVSVLLRPFKVAELFRWVQQHFDAGGARQLPRVAPVGSAGASGLVASPS